ncbi:MAG: hypothetical protein Q9165_001627 [Trypethelium subeluteriae]
MTMPTKLNVVALISGGKDSVFSIYHCRAKGHEIVALANLFPPGDGREGEDMNSFMYQTVGHSIISLYEKAFQLPLFRKRIQGLATNTDKYYCPPVTSTSLDGPFPQDETESLYHLLSLVKTAHPEVDAVCTGAILSDYQRSRVESVALRLGLQSLAYLWQYPYLPPHTQTSLLEDMESIRHRAIIIKVASAGLNESFLGQNVADSRTIVKLRNAMGKFGPIEGGSVLGEGGEYETLSVDGPGNLWGEAVAIDPEQTQIITGEGGTAVLNIRNARLSRKDSLHLTKSESLRIPEGMDPEFARLRIELETAPVKQRTHRTREDDAPFTIGTIHRFSVHLTRNLLYINNLSASTNTQNNGGVDEQMSVIISHLASILKGNNLQDPDIIFSTLILRSMSDFKAINMVYGALFSRPQPPARVTVACGSSLPKDVDVTLSVVVNQLDASLRRGLHVQSISYWAPANIGPYSQAVGVTSDSGSEDGKTVEVVYMAGQIPLVPATMELVNRGDTIAEFKEQTVLSLQHLWRVGRAMAVENWLVGIAFVATPSEHLQIPVDELADVALDAWSSLYSLARSLDHQDEESEAEGVDVWDQKYGLHRQDRAHSSRTTDTRHLLPNLARLKSRARPEGNALAGEDPSTTAHCFVLEVDELPRGARIEWTGFGLVNSDLALNSQLRSKAVPGVVDAAGRQFGPSREFKNVDYWSCRIEQTGETYVWLGIEDVKETSMEAICREILHDRAMLPNCIVYAGEDLPASFVGDLAVQIIPCKSVWDSGGRSLAAVAFFRIQREEMRYEDI